MNCERVEKWIYIFDELDEEERAGVNRHVASCMACQKFFLRIRNEKDIMRRALMTLPDNANRARLTSNIMAAINREDDHRLSVVEIAVGHLFSKPVQYGLLAWSLILGISFIIEYNQSNRLPLHGSLAQSTQKASVELNSILFYQEFNRMKQAGISRP